MANPVSRRVGWLMGVLLAGCSSAQYIETEVIGKPRAVLGKFNTPFSNTFECSEVESLDNYSVFVTRDSRFFDVGCGRASEIRRNTDLANTEELAENVAKLRDRTKNIFDTINDRKCEEDDCVKKIVFFIHGGLATINTNIPRTAMLRAQMVKSGYNPVFINWRSGFLSSYWDHLWRLRQGVTSKWAKTTSLPYFASDLLKTVANVPWSWITEAYHAWNSVGKDYDYVEDEKYRPANVSLVSNDNKKNRRRMVRWWITSPAKVFTAPIVHTLGKPPWDVMRRRALTMSLNPHEDPESRPNEINIDSLGVIGKFFELFGQHIAASEEQGNRFELVLVGHSMGVITVNQLLSMKSELVFDKIVQMASADTVQATLGSVVPYLQQHQDAEYYGLHLHPNNEDREVKWGGVVPSGSLLVWIDNMYTTPATILERTAGRWDNMSKALALFPEERVHHKIFGRTNANAKSCDKGAICVPQKHSEFTEAAFWLPEFFE